LSDGEKVLGHGDLQEEIIANLNGHGQGKRRLGRIFALCVLILCLPSCEFPRENRPSILLIAVDGLSFNSLNCDAEELGESSLEGLRVFCGEAVRFSHAFTTSTMSQAALSSVLTGLYPFDHGVRTNGNDFLSARFRTLAEIASHQRFHTLFISGGAPVWRKSGLAQGYEVFDDTIDLNPKAPYRPAGEVVKLALNWLEQTRDGRPFFATLFFADLQFPLVPTVSDTNDVRAKGGTSQVSEVMESINGLVKYLKKQKLWNKTNIALFGLNSLDRPANAADPAPLSLKSSSTQIALFIKPARKEADNEISWAIDRNVSLTDVGFTVFSWLGGENPPASSLPELQPRTLASVLDQPEPNWGEERLILSESAWADWLKGAGVRWALRQKHFLYIHDQKPLIYNTLTDKLENMPLKAADPLWSSLSTDVTALIRRAQVPPFRGMTGFWQEQLAVARELWREGDAHRRPRAADPWMKWYLRRALIEKNWRDVKRISQDMGEPVGAYVAAKHLHESLPLPRNPCVRLILAAKNNRSYQPECADEKILALHAWRSALSEEDRAAAQERFTRLYNHDILDQEIGRQNYLGELRWDVDREMPPAPMVVDYLLTLKEFEAFSRKLPGLRDAEDARL